MNVRTPGLVLSAALLLTTTACSGSDKETLTVLAASSLTEVFDQLEQTYEADQPDIDVQISYDSSSVLAEQIGQDAPADVFASADEPNMAKVVDAGLTTGRVPVFANNTLVLVTPPDNPAEIDSISDLSNSAVTYVVCVPEAPCGNASEQLLGDNGITAPAASEEENVKAVLTKITTGEADAGLVYVTDAQAAGDQVNTVQVPGADQILNAYPVAVLTDAADQQAAQDWVSLLLSEEGQSALADAGFKTVT